LFNKIRGKYWLWYDQFNFGIKTKIFSDDCFLIIRWLPTDGFIRMIIQIEITNILFTKQFFFEKTSNKHLYKFKLKRLDLHVDHYGIFEIVTLFYIDPENWVSTKYK